MQVVGEEGGKGRGGGEASETRQGQQDTDAVWRRKIKTAGHPMTPGDAGSVLFQPQLHNPPVPPLR